MRAVMVVGCVVSLPASICLKRRFFSHLPALASSECLPLEKNNNNYNASSSCKATRRFELKGSTNEMERKGYDKGKTVISHQNKRESEINHAGIGPYLGNMSDL